jgi:uncharacterized alkaline shock family protein YloU
MHEEDDKKSKKEKEQKIKQSIGTTEVKAKVLKDIEKKENIVKDNLGEIKIAPEVLATIVSRTVIDIQGVAGLVAHSKSGFGTLLGVKEMEEGIKVDLIDGKHMSVFISVIVEYGSVIIDVAKNIQSVVKSEIENKTGLIVKSIDVNIMGIQMPRKNVKSSQVEK